ncbi:hypothetical protein SPRG_09089 [Saprolegnia parasitica CBS 223.65]|uniref:F-box domain-containing protein n=1 Tax=Saprolegnia parasitica (strain CBS 223.65) TaxID=695850 RepID=A0A067C4V1_SAPPC|nr:hypothetical protein SPRG_09089 [Saprolegnia parasitica CBS 223.65]KDO25794.1 hypothetical protein SPRG_09089 [Saprolegnia parasitica CBS 223.65]|eukprot:XP_012203597.1 hypothetical protein SPRG_09089 [Saprolegnia parasitica CBS 223.65]
MRKRPCGAPMAVLHAGFLNYIVQCLASTKDVLSLLQALPCDALDEALTALRTLVSTPRALHAGHWPQVCIEDIDGCYTATVLAALSVFGSVRMHHLSRLDEVLRATSSEPGADGSATIAFAAKWGHKIKSIRLTAWREHNINVLVPILCLCTGLDYIIVHAAEADPRILEAVACTTPFVTRMYLTCFGGKVVACESWLASMTTWLASGRARELALVGFESADSKILARAIVGAASLTSLTLRDADSLVQGLVDTATPLPHLTVLCLDMQRDTTSLKSLLTNCIELSALRVLDVRDSSTMDNTFLLALLPRLVALEELSLWHCRMECVHSLTLAPAPRRLQALTVYRSFMDDTSCLSLLDWASQSPCLKTISLDAVATVRSQPVHLGRYVRRWIAAGVERVTIPNTSLGVESVIAIAMALCDTYRSSRFVLYIGDGSIIMASYAALATCSNVTLEVFEPESCKMTH